MENKVSYIVREYPDRPGFEVKVGLTSENKPVSESIEYPWIFSINIENLAVLMQVCLSYTQPGNLIHTEAVPEFLFKNSSLLAPKMQAIMNKAHADSRPALALLNLRDSVNQNMANDLLTGDLTAIMAGVLVDLTGKMLIDHRSASQKFREVMNAKVSEALAIDETGPGIN